MILPVVNDFLLEQNGKMLCISIYQTRSVENTDMDS